MHKEQSSTCKIHVSNLPAHMTHEAIHHFFSQYGPVSLDVNRTKRVPKGHCVLTVPTSVASSLKTQRISLSGRIVVCADHYEGAMLRLKNKMVDQKRVLATNIPSHFTEDAVRQCLVRFGAIESVSMGRDFHKGATHKSASIQFLETESASFAIAQSSVNTSFGPLFMEPFKRTKHPRASGRKLDSRPQPDQPASQRPRAPGKSQSEIQVPSNPYEAFLPPYKGEAFLISYKEPGVWTRSYDHSQANIRFNISNRPCTLKTNSQRGLAKEPFSREETKCQSSRVFPGPFNEA